MSKKNIRLTKVGISWIIMFCGAVIALTAWRLSVAFSGGINESEAFLAVCATHPSGGYVEGPAGLPLLLVLNRIFLGTGVTALRWVSPAALLLLSWSVWWIGMRLFPHRPAIALWSVLCVNILPQVSIASLVMDGAMVTASIILLAVVAGWRAVEEQDRNSPASWTFFGIVLGIGTLFFYPIGWLLPVALIWRFRIRGMKNFPWYGALGAFALLVAGWIAPLVWNFRHDWIQWSSVAFGFDTIHYDRFSCSLGFLVAVSSLIVPFLVRLAYAGVWWRAIILVIAVVLSGISFIILLDPSLIPSGFPSPIGVQGVGRVADSVVKFREGRPDTHSQKPFLIASTPGLAALLGNRIALEYPERPGAPSVFAVESPSLNSSYSLWPGYADAIAAAAKDPFYTEEKSVSPFLGRNAIYITTESRDELPQTITGAFGAVGLLNELPLDWNGRRVIIRIYQCEQYRSLSL